MWRCWNRRGIPSRKLLSCRLLTCASLLAGCSEVVSDLGAGDAAVDTSALRGDRPERSDTSDASDCVDLDGDGYGTGASCRGPDCDDHDATITACDGCELTDPRPGCACTPDAAPLACDLSTGISSAGPDGICHLGQRSCERDPSGRGWRWSACVRWRPDFQYIGPISECPGSCLPTCRHQVLCPTAGDPFPEGASNLRVASEHPAVFCPTATARGGLTTTCSAATPMRCDAGVVRMTFVADCAPRTSDPSDIFRLTLGYWGQFNYTSSVPDGASIRFELRAANTLAELPTERAVALPEAPAGAPAVPTSVNLRRILRDASTPTELLRSRLYIQITAYLSPSPDGTAAPTLISAEVQYACYSSDLL